MAPWSSIRMTMLGLVAIVGVLVLVRPGLDADEGFRGGFGGGATGETAAVQQEQATLLLRVTAAEDSARQQRDTAEELRVEAASKAAALTALQARTASLESEAAKAKSAAEEARKALGERDTEVAGLKATAATAAQAVASAAAAVKTAQDAAAAAKAAADRAIAAAAAPPSSATTTGGGEGSAISLRRFAPRLASAHVKPVVASEDPKASRFNCVGKDVYDHACAIANICYNTTAERAGDRHPVFEMFTGTHSPLHPDASKPGADERVRGACLPMNDEASPPSWQCKNDRSIFAGSLADGPLVWRPYVYDGPIPEDRVQAWFEEPLVILNRHWPSNIAHAIADDYFPLFQMQRDWLGWDPEAQAVIQRDQAPPPVGQEQPKFSEDDVPALPPGVDITANLIYLDRSGFWDFSGRILPILYPNLRFFSRTKLEKTMRNPEKPLVCFRTAIAGAPGLSMHRNGAYVYHNARTWPKHVLGADPAGYIASHAEFVEFFLASLQLPSKAQAQALIDAPPAPGAAKADVLFKEALVADGSGLGSILVINRKAKRELRNIDAVVHAIQEVAGGRRVVVADWSGLNTRDQAALALAADLVVAIHGAGAINSIFLRPGAAWIDLLPPRATNFAPTFMATAQRFGIRWYTLPLHEEDCKPDTDAHNQPFFDADITAVKGFAALALGTEARR